MSTSNSFCILPWVHARLNHDGNVYPCCRQTELKSFGSLKENTFEEIWNGEPLREMRRSLLEGNKVKGCEDCYRIEEAGSVSLRQTSNATFADAFDRVTRTDETGRFEDEGLLSLDLRFSNACNFRCRSCGPQNSVAWYPEARALTGEKWDVVLKPGDEGEFWKLLEARLPRLRMIYFAGGEPLLENMHYQLLEKLIELGRTEILLDYNTNFSTFKKGDWDAIKLWQKFPRVSIGASLDGVDAQGELLRKGMNWSEIENNFYRLKSEAPHVQFFIHCTVTAMNAFHLPVAIQKFHELGMVTRPEHLAINVAYEPNYMSLGIFNAKERDLLRKTYADFSERAPEELASFLKVELQRIISNLPEEDQPKTRELFRRYTFALDRSRKESTVLIFPELFDAIMDN